MPLECLFLGESNKNNKINKHGSSLALKRRHTNKQQQSQQTRELISARKTSHKQGTTKSTNKGVNQRSKLVKQAQRNNKRKLLLHPASVLYHPPHRKEKQTNNKKEEQKKQKKTRKTTESKKAVCSVRGGYGSLSTPLFPSRHSSGQINRENKDSGCGVADRRLLPPCFLCHSKRECCWLASVVAAYSWVLRQRQLAPKVLLIS